MVNMQSPQNRPIISLKNVCKSYGTGELRIPILQNLSLTVRQGEYCAIVGPSGSGKSTIMNIIGCLDRPDRGEYYFDDRPVVGLDRDRLAAIRNLKIGFVFQQFYLLPQLSVLENVLLPMAYAKVPYLERDLRAKEVLTKVGLKQKIDSYPDRLSGGQQQRVAIARAIVNRPFLLLADEPTGSLDSVTKQEIMSIFQDLHSKGITIIVVTHDRTVANSADRIICFQDGQIVN